MKAADVKDVFTKQVTSLLDKSRTRETKARNSVDWARQASLTFVGAC